MTSRELLETGSGLAVALVLSAVLVPLADRLGRRLHFIRHRALAEGRRLGALASGVALLLSALAGLAIAHGLDGSGGGVLACGVILLLLGLVDDRSRKGGVAGWVRLGAGIFVALLAWAAGAAVQVAHPGMAGFLLSLALLVALPSAFAALDVMGGVAAATGAGCAAGLLALGLLAHQTLEATLGATVLGACLGFLRLDVGGSGKNLGSGGSLLLGFLLALTALRLRLPAGGTTNLLAILACLAVPLADTAVVLVPRFLAARPLWRPGTDRLAHRLSRLGMHRRGIILAHTEAALAGGVAAALSVHTRSPLPAAVVLVAVAAGAAVLAFVRTGEAHRPHRLRQTVVGVAVVAVGLLAVSAVAAVLAEGQLSAARANLVQAESSLKALQLPAASAALNRAQPELGHAEHLLSSPLTLPARVVPVLRSNVAVANALARSGLALVAAGRQGVQVLASLKATNGHVELPLVNGAINLAPFTQAAGPAAALDADIAQAQRLAAASPSTWLLPTVQSARTQALVQLAKAGRAAQDARAATVLIPAAFGASGAQTWVIGAENLAEQRGRGGYMGSIGVATATKGRLSLGTFVSNGVLPTLPTSTVLAAPPPEYAAHYAALGALGAWQNLTMSPSFASGGDVLLGMLHAATGLNANGLIGVDPVALADLLAVTGPVSVPGFPVPLTSANVVSWALNQVYVEYPNDSDRHDVLSGVAQLIFQKVIAGGVDPRALAAALGKALDGNHLAIYSTNPSLEALINQAGIGGDLSPTTGDYLLVVGQNQGENKMDYYAERQISYEGRVQPDGSEQVTLTITDKNTASPAVALPAVIGGSRSDINLPPGVDRTYLSTLVPQAAVLESASIDGKTTTDLDNLPELGKRIFGTYVDVAPGASATLRFHYYLPAAVVGGTYRLTVQDQAMVHPDRLSVDIQVPAGYTIGGTGASANGDPGQEFTWTGNLAAGQQITASVSESVLQSIADHL